MTELAKILKYEGFEEKFENLKKSTLLNLPNNVEEFVNEVQMYEGNTDNNINYEVNRYHLYNETFTSLRLEAALAHFRNTIQDLDIDDERIQEAYRRLSESWVSNYENAMDEVLEFDRLIKLLQ